MSKSITIRDVPDQARNELAVRASRKGQSLQEYLRSHLIDLAERPDPEELFDRIRDRKARTGTHLPRERILSHRDADRR